MRRWAMAGLRMLARTMQGRAGKPRPLMHWARPCWNMDRSLLEHAIVPCWNTDRSLLEHGSFPAGTWIAPCSVSGITGSSAGVPPVECGKLVAASLPVLPGPWSQSCLGVPLGWPRAHVGPCPPLPSPVLLGGPQAASLWTRWPSWSSWGHRAHRACLLWLGRSGRASSGPGVSPGRAQRAAQGPLHVPRMLLATLVTCCYLFLLVVTCCYLLLLVARQGCSTLCAFHALSPGRVYPLLQELDTVTRPELRRGHV